MSKQHFEIKMTAALIWKANKDRLPASFPILAEQAQYWEISCKVAQLTESKYHAVACCLRCTATCLGDLGWRQPWSTPRNTSQPLLLFPATFIFSSTALSFFSPVIVR